MKAIKINSCFHCYYRMTDNNLPHNYCSELGKGVGEHLKIRPIKIHPECPLEDYKDYKHEISKIIVEIQQEILKNPTKPNIGKKGCIARLENLIHNTK